MPAKSNSVDLLWWNLGFLFGKFCFNFFIVKYHFCCFFYLVEGKRSSAEWRDFNCMVYLSNFRHMINFKLKLIIVQTVIKFENYHI